MPESITITDNRTGDQLEIPISMGAYRCERVAKAAARYLVLRPGLLTTAACEIVDHLRRR